MLNILTILWAWVISDARKTSENFISQNWGNNRVHCFFFFVNGILTEIQNYYDVKLYHKCSRGWIIESERIVETFVDHLINYSIPQRYRLYKCFVNHSATFSLTLITAMAKPIKLFQPIEMVFRSFGIRAFGPELMDRVSFKYFFFLICTLINVASSLGFFLFEANTVADCGDSFYQASTMSTMAFHLMTYCWKSLEIHRLIRQFDRLFKISKLEIFNLKSLVFTVQCCKFSE